MMTNEPDGNEIVAQAWSEFDDWHGTVCHDMPEHLEAEWEAMSMQMQIYFYSRENPMSVDCAIDQGWVDAGTATR